MRDTDWFFSFLFFYFIFLICFFDCNVKEGLLCMAIPLAIIYSCAIVELLFVNQSQ